MNVYVPSDTDVNHTEVHVINWKYEFANTLEVNYPNFRYPNTFSKATLTISGYFNEWEAGFSL